MRSLLRSAALAPLVLGLVGAACSDTLVPDSTCAVSLDPALGCNQTADAGTVDLGLVGYACAGSARPDDTAHYYDGVPQGTVCTDRGALASGAQGYCCSQAVTPCAYNPVADCAAPNYGYQCRGAGRPGSFNALLNCGQGWAQGDLINYCCSGTPQTPGCIQSDGLGCSQRLLGFTCAGQNLPLAEQLGANKSRADYYRLLCPTPTPADNPGRNNYCCYAPALVPIGGSCVQDTAVPGCPAGHFGFACYGPETPEDDYLPMSCKDPGFPGTSAEGYPATLYCCEFQ